MPLRPDELLHSQYRIVRLLGRGGFGAVYLAHDTVLGADVAIKELIPGLAGDKDALKRFIAEARATMQLTHDRIVRTYSVFARRDNYYIVMESTCRAARWRRACATSAGRWRSPRRSRWPPTSVGVSRTRTAWGWCTATSSRPTSSSTRAGGPRSPTSASPTSPPAC